MVDVLLTVGLGVCSWLGANVCEVLELPADMLHSGEPVSTGPCLNVKPRFTGGRGVRRLGEGGPRLWWPPVDTDTH